MLRVFLVIIMLSTYAQALNMPSKFMLIKHRCNTIEEMQRAKDEGFDGVEMDLQYREEKMIIELNHDPIKHRRNDIINHKYTYFAHALKFAKENNVKLTIHILDYNKDPFYKQKILQAFLKLVEPMRDVIFSIGLHERYQFYVLRDLGYNVYGICGPGSNEVHRVEKINCQRRTWMLKNHKKGIEGIMADTIQDAMKFNMLLSRKCGEAA